MDRSKQDLIFYTGIGAGFLVGLIFYFSAISPNYEEAQTNLERARNQAGRIEQLTRGTPAPLPGTANGAPPAEPAADRSLTLSTERASVLQDQTAQRLAQVGALQKEAIRLVFTLPDKYGTNADNARQVIEERLMELRKNARQSNRFMNTRYPLGLTTSFTEQMDDEADDEQRVEKLAERLAVAERIVLSVRRAQVPTVFEIKQMDKKPDQIVYGEQYRDGDKRVVLKKHIRRVAMQVKLRCDEAALARLLFELQNVSGEKGNGRSYVGVQSIAINVKDIRQDNFDVTAVLYGSFLENRPPPRTKNDGFRPGRKRWR